MKAGQPDFDAVLWEVISKRLPGHRDVMNELDRLATAWKPKYLVIERNIAGPLMLDPAFKEWQRVHSIEVLDPFTGRNRNDLTIGPSTLAADFEFGRHPQDVSILAFVCKRLPRCPDPDLALKW